MGKSGDAADAYAKEVVAANFDAPGDEDMLAKVRKDLAASKVAIDDKALMAKLHALHDDAARQIMGEIKK